MFLSPTRERCAAITRPMFGMCYLSSTDFQKEKGPDMLYTKVTKVVLESMDFFIPNKIIRKKHGNKVWFDDLCKEKAMQKGYLYDTKWEQKNYQEFQHASLAFNRPKEQTRHNYNLKLKTELTGVGWVVRNGRTLSTCLPAGNIIPRYLLLKKMALHTIYCNSEVAVFCQTLPDVFRAHHSSKLENVPSSQASRPWPDSYKGPEGVLCRTCNVMW